MAVGNGGILKKKKQEENGMSNPNPLNLPTPVNPIEQFKQQPQNTNPPLSANQPVINPQVSSAPAYDTSTAAGRFAAFGVAPNQASNEVNAAIRNQYNQNNANNPIKQLQNQQNEAAAIANFQANQQANATAQAQPLINQVGNVAPAEQPTADYGAFSTLRNAIGTLSERAQTAANTGGVGTGTANAVVQGAIKAFTGITNRYLTGALEGDAQDAKVATTGFIRSKDGMKQTINALNQGIIDQTQAIKLYNQELANINDAEAKLKFMTRDKFGQELSQGLDELAKIEEFRRTELRILNAKMAEALATPSSANQLAILPETQ